MLNKIAHIILSFTLLVSTTGFTISKHYCGDKVESIAVNSTTESCCEMPGCCHDETTFYKVNDDFSVSAIDNQIQISATDLLFSAVFIVIPQEEITAELSIPSAAESPPPLKTQITLSLFQTYLC